jgi:hypothetical protein
MEPLDDENKRLGGIIAWNASNEAEEIKTVLERVKVRNCDKCRNVKADLLNNFLN